MQKRLRTNLSIGKWPLILPIIQSVSRQATVTAGEHAVCERNGKRGPQLRTPAHTPALITTAGAAHLCSSLGEVSFHAHGRHGHPAGPSTVTSPGSHTLVPAIPPGQLLGAATRQPFLCNSGAPTFPQGLALGFALDLRCNFAVTEKAARAHRGCGSHRL